MSKPKARTLVDFHVYLDRDAPRLARISGVLKKIDNAWLYELELCRAAHVGAREMPRYRLKFKDYCFEMNDQTGNGRSRFIWCGTISFAKRLIKAQTAVKL
jgi:hypothetical protein